MDQVNNRSRNTNETYFQPNQPPETVSRLTKGYRQLLKTATTGNQSVGSTVAQADILFNEGIPSHPPYLTFRF